MKTSPLICYANQWTGFYRIVTHFMKELKNKKLNEVKTVEIIIKTPQIIHVQKEVLPLHKPLDHAYE